jgi:hypothetical protein
MLNLRPREGSTRGKHCAGLTPGGASPAPTGDTAVEPSLVVHASKENCPLFEKQGGNLAKDLDARGLEDLAEEVEQESR